MSCTPEDCTVTVPAVGLDVARADLLRRVHQRSPSTPTSATPATRPRPQRGESKTGKQNPTAKAVSLAWDAVGVHNGCKPGTPPPPPCVGSSNATLPIESPHPYGNNGDCTWTYTNGQAGF